MSESFALIMQNVFTLIFHIIRQLVCAIFAAKSSNCVEKPKSSTLANYTSFLIFIVGVQLLTIYIPRYKV